ncbi:hypothetical protein FEM48_Zijuj07G0044100 [Ziziphus jujuba var. spinosa]|uniref:Protein PRD1 n=1 Tax=Ziziphus jujuba var. spinosa TaxID=714518 RepID=A0A978V2F4_ZIZJJ|nr:hypothetical protein FEM48_Zijuj07G0044100 [Ziziphus jujuba var. spinosa]
MYWNDSQELPHYEPEEEEDEDEYEANGEEEQQWRCSVGHRSSLILRTQQGGAICLLCFSNLVSNPLSPTLHVSYALSQLSSALSQPPFLRTLISFHPLLLVSPLVHALSSFDDHAIARQVLDLVSLLCDSSSDSDGGDCSILAEFVSRVSDRLSSGALAWSRRQVYVLHCLGVLLKSQKNNPYTYIKDKYGLVSNLVAGLQLPSEEIRGEILFVLYKVSVLQNASVDSEGIDLLFSFCPKLLRLSLEALIKTQSDDVRLNCVALLTVLAQRGFFGNSYSTDSSSMDSCEDETNRTPLNNLFAEAIKGPLLSTDSQVQISTVDLLFHYMSCECASGKEIQILVEENIADYVFEILRLSECKDPVVNPCLQALDLLSTAKQAFKQRLVVGFATLIPVLQYVAGIPFHPGQSQTLKLIWNCVSDCPGMASASHVKELVLILTKMLQKHTDGEMGMIPETFIMACSVFVALTKSPSSHGTLGLTTSIKEASQNAVLSCLSASQKNPSLLLHSLYLLKEAYVYGCEENSTNSSTKELQNCIVDVCTTHLLPWLATNFNEMEEEIILGVLETFHSILLQDSDIQAILFAETLVASSWFSLSFGCLGLFPTEKMKCRVYLMLSSLVDLILGNDSGQPIRDNVLHLPSDPIDLLFLLGQKSSHNLELSSCQSAVLTILYTASLYDERLADDKVVLSSLEQYILANSSDFQYRSTCSSTVMRLVYLYGLYRGLAKVTYQILYSPEAERILFQLLNETEWDLPSARIHPISLKWLFQQEKICKPLSDQILKFCRSNISNCSTIKDHGKNCTVNVQALAQLVAAGDNYGATLLVCLLTQMVKEEVREHEIISLINLMTTIIDIFPAASDQLSLHNIANAIHTFYYESSHEKSSQISMAMLVLIYDILCSVHPETLSDDETWLAVTIKLMDYVNTEAVDKWSSDHLFVLGILSLILHHSCDKAFTETSKTILFNSSLGSTINRTIDAVCLKGPALVDHDEGSSTGPLVFVLLLNYFALKSLHAVLPGIVDWQTFFDPLDKMQPLSLICIHCHALCRLMYFGSPPIKLVSSYCLLELFARISEQRIRKREELKCTIEYLKSVMAVLEGLVIYNDLRVSVNCGLCLSMILGWEIMDMEEASVIGKNSWGRVIIEELVMSMAVPCIASKSFISHYKPAIYVAVALLKLRKHPQWLKSVFDDSCISGIIENLTASNVSTEIVLLFQELLNSEFLKTEQLATLNRVLKACRKRMYIDNNEGDCAKEHIKKAVTVSDDLEEVCAYLIYLMSSASFQNGDSQGSHFGNKSLLEEIEMFLRTSTVEDDS